LRSPEKSSPRQRAQRYSPGLVFAGTVAAANIRAGGLTEAVSLPLDDDFFESSLLDEEILDLLATADDVPECAEGTDNAQETSSTGSPHISFDVVHKVMHRGSHASVIDDLEEMSISAQLGHAAGEEWSTGEDSGSAASVNLGESSLAEPRVGASASHACLEALRAFLESDQELPADFGSLM
jgi:hypothetical protein